MIDYKREFSDLLAKFTAGRIEMFVKQGSQNHPNPEVKIQCQFTIHDKNAALDCYKTVNRRRKNNPLP